MLSDAGWCRGENEAPAALGWEAGRSGRAGPRRVRSCCLPPAMPAKAFHASAQGTRLVAQHIGNWLTCCTFCASPLPRALWATRYHRSTHSLVVPWQADLREAMDPVAQADGAADLNLKLMKWRAAPSLDLARLASTKCLLLGAGAVRCVCTGGVVGVLQNTGDRMPLCVRL